MHVQKQNEDGTNQIVWEGNYPYPEKLLDQIGSLNPSDGTLLRGIAPYEDTYFNSQQTKNLIDELEQLKDALNDSGDRRAIESLIKFAGTVELQEHLVFIGD